MTMTRSKPGVWKWSVGARVIAAVALLLSVVVAGAMPATAAGNRWPRNVVNGFSTPTAHGFWLAYANGDVVTNGDAHFYGSAVQLPLNGPITGGAVAPGGTGYWLVATDGGIFSYGSARFHGSMGAAHLNQPVFSMSATKLGHGYWLVARDGGIFTFGDAHFYGSTGSLVLNQPIVGITTSPAGKGYRMVARDGGIFSFGDVPFYGSLPGRGVNVTDVVGAAQTPTDTGYWLARSDGKVDAFGKAHTFRKFAASPCDPVTAIFADPVAQGYRLVTRSGQTISFGAYGAGRTGTTVRCRKGH
jgi:hypothetical protein